MNTYLKKTIPKLGSTLTLKVFINSLAGRGTPLFIFINRKVYPTTHDSVGKKKIRFPAPGTPENVFFTRMYGSPIYTYKHAKCQDDSHNSLGEKRL